MPVRRIRGHWCAELRENGRRHRVRAHPNTKFAAEKLWHELHERTLAAPSTTDTSFSALSARWLTEHVAIHNRKSTHRTRECHLRLNLLPFFGTRLAREIRTSDVDRLTAKLVKDGAHPKRVNDILCTLRSCLIKGRDWDMLERLPRFTLLKCPPPSKEFLSLEEARRLVAAAPPGESRAMILVALTTGLRIGELIALRWDRVNFDLQILTVALTETRGDVTAPKSGAERELPLVPEVVSALLALPRIGERIFPAPPHITSTYNYFWRALFKISQVASVNARWHLLRHTFASHLVMASGSLEAAQDCLGHSTPTMTRRYAHLSKQFIRSRVRMLPSFSENGHMMGTSSAETGAGGSTLGTSDEQISAESTQNRDLPVAA